MANAENKTIKTEPLGKQLWKAADKLRKNIDAAEYKHIESGLIFLKYISDSFEQHFALYLLLLVIGTFFHAIYFSMANSLSIFS
jgi:hypothetical protein